MTQDPFVSFDAMQREPWTDFAVNEAFTTPLEKESKESL